GPECIHVRVERPRGPGRSSDVGRRHAALAARGGETWATGGATAGLRPPGVATEVVEAADGVGRAVARERAWANGDRAGGVEDGAAFDESVVVRQGAVADRHCAENVSDGAAASCCRVVGQDAVVDRHRPGEGKDGAAGGGSGVTGQGAVVDAQRAVDGDG